MCLKFIRAKTLTFVYKILLFITSIYCSISSASIFQTITLPKPQGKFSVGTKCIHINDSSRSMLRGKDPKRWKINVYYPIQRHNNTYPYMPDTINDGIVQGVQILAHAKPNAMPLKFKRLPTIIFIPGRGAIGQKYTILLEELASQGFLVLAMDQPYAASFVRFSKDEIIVPTFKDIWTVPRDREYRYIYDDENINATIGDIKYILGNLRVLGEFSEVCDPSCIVLMGHSIGANVSHILGFQDKSVKLIIDIDSKITERKIFGYVGPPPNLSKTPILFIRGTRQYQDDVGDQLTKIQNAELWRPDVEHSAFSDDAYFSAKFSGFGKQSYFSDVMNWFFKKGPHFSSIDTSIGEKEVDIWFEEYRNNIVSWIKTKLG